METTNLTRYKMAMMVALKEREPSVLGRRFHNLILDIDGQFGAILALLLNIDSLHRQVTYPIRSLMRSVPEIA